MAWEPFHNSSVEIWKILQLHTECVKKTCSAAPFEYHSRLEDHIQVSLKQVTDHGAQGNSRRHAIDRRHRTLFFGVRLDMCHRLTQICQEALGNTGLGMAQGDTQMNTGRLMQPIQAPFFYET